MSDQNHQKDSSPAPDLVARPQVSLLGEVNEAMVSTLLEQLSSIDDGDGPVVIELTTLGGDAEMARRMVLEIDIARQRLAPRRLVFLGKTTVYSAGITVMSAFAHEDRYLAEDAVLLIHVRQLEKTLQVDGPMRESLSQVEALVHQMRTGMKLEEGNFARLLKGSTLELDDVLQRALYNWYISADEAAELGLVAGVLKTGGA